VVGLRAVDPEDREDFGLRLCEGFGADAVAGLVARLRVSGSCVSTVPIKDTNRGNTHGYLLVERQREGRAAPPGTTRPTCRLPGTRTRISLRNRGCPRPRSHSLRRLRHLEESPEPSCYDQPLNDQPSAPGAIRTHTERDLNPLP